jgi:hypothetical protein
MRKRYRIKRRSCGLCKPHKRGLANRWKPRDLARLRAAEADVSAQGGTGPRPADTGSD